MVLSAEKKISTYVQGYQIRLPGGGLRDIIKCDQYWT